MSERVPAHGKQHPSGYREDMYGDAGADENVSPAERPYETRRTAFDVKEAHEILGGFSDEELRRIPIVEDGVRLRQGSKYLSLREPRAGEFTATAEIIAGPDDLYVPKDGVDYDTWNRLKQAA
jgi:hypothetical protein